MSMVECPTCGGTGIVEEADAAHTARAVQHLNRVIERSHDRPKERGWDRLNRAKAESLDAALDAKFGLPDGRRVAWRDATRDDVAAWVKMLTDHIEGMRESRSIGDRALREFAETGAGTVGAMPRVAQLRIFRPESVPAEPTAPLRPKAASGPVATPARAPARKPVASGNERTAPAKKAAASKRASAAPNRSRRRAA